MNTRECTKCSKELPIEDFYTIINKRTLKKYTYTYCRKCHYNKMTKHTSAKWRKDNPKRWNVIAYKAQKDYWKRQKKGVYLLITTKGLYVGASDKITSRVLQHRGQQPGNVGHKGAKIITWFVLEEQNDKRDRLDAEKKWIKRLNPMLNQIHTTRFIHSSKKSTN